MASARWRWRNGGGTWKVAHHSPPCVFAVHGDPYVMSSKPSDPHNIVAAEADGNGKENDEPMLDREDADETGPQASPKQKWMQHSTV